MLVDLFLLLIPLVWVGIASIIDLQTREVPDWISYSLVLLGLAIRGSYAILYADAFFFLTGLLALPLAFLFGSFMYYTKQWGGGDSKLLMGLAVMYATTPSMLAEKLSIPFLAAFLLNLVIIGALYGIGYASILGIRNRHAVLCELRKHDYSFLRYLWVFFAIAAILNVLLVRDAFLRITILLLLLGLALLSYLTIFTKIVERTCMHKNVQIKKLREGDWLVYDVYARGKLLVKAKTVGLGKDDLRALRHASVKTVMIKEGMPFVPAFFAALLLTILYGPVIPFPDLATLLTAAFFSAQ